MTLHPQSERFIASLLQNQRPGWETMSPVDARENFEHYVEFAGNAVPVNQVTDQLIAQVPVRVYRNQENTSDVTKTPCVVYFHGGGWVLGSLNTHDALCRKLSVHSDCVIIAVDYGLAPESSFPKPLDDCFAVTRWVLQHGAELGIDPERVALAGDSAGGNLAAAVALKADMELTPAIDFQVLIYPITDSDFDRESYQSFREGYGLTLANMRWFWEQYMGKLSSMDDPLAAVLHHPLSQTLAPALIVTAEYDVLRDEGEAYAERLSKFGIQTTLKRYDGMLHGFVHFAGLFDTGDQAITEIGQTIRARLHRD